MPSLGTGLRNMLEIDVSLVETAIGENTDKRRDGKKDCEL
jgi:hypothetical protein